MTPKNPTMTTVTGIEARSRLLDGARQVFEAVKSTYGPQGNNVLYPDQLDEPILTRDGVTVARQMNLESGTPEDFGAQLIKSASGNTNKQAGDGTTLTVVFAYHLIERANKLIAGGYNPMTVRSTMQESAKAVLNYLEKNKVDISGDQLEQVAIVSCGDEQIGKLIASTVEQVGKDGGITVEKTSTKGVSVDIVRGFYFDAGFPTTASVERVFEDILVLPLDRIISSATEIIPILEYINGSDTKKCIIVGELAGDALNNYIVNLRNAAYDGALVKAIGYGTERTEFLEDLALVTGGKVLRAGNVLNQQTIGEYFGSAKKIEVTERNTTIIDGAGSQEDVDAKLLELNKSDGADDYRKDSMQRRANRLAGKIALIRVGGDSEIEADELKFRVDDAVQAARAALEEGVLPGGGTMLVKASKLKNIDPMYADALQQPFLELMNNANERADYRLELVLRAKDGYGFNLRDLTDDPVNLLSFGIVDPYKVIRLAVANATSTASNLITTNCVIYRDSSNEDSDTDITNG